MIWAYQALLKLRGRVKDERGQDMIEYALLLMLMSIIVIGVWPQGYANSIFLIWTRVRQEIFRVTGV
jgi:Flp pilus assembly pilin Flp